MKRLKQYLLHLLPAVIFTVLLSAPASFSAEKPQNFLWRITTPNSTAYILGSIHLMKPEMYPLASAIEAAYKSSNTLIVEINLNKIDPLKAAEIVSSNAVYSDSRTLKSSVSESTYAQAAAKLRDIGMDIEIFQKAKPWMVAVTLTDISLRRLGFDPVYGIDNYFLKKSGAKKIIELESLESQISLFSTFSEKEQELFLIYTIRDLENLRRDMDLLIEYWRAGDAGKVEKLLTSGIEKTSELQQIYRRLFTERNFSMTLKIESILKKQGTYFIVVGAGHLVGESGIINLLQKKGFRLQQM
ncbi:MAG: TraB/GumN family protein [Dissulfurispiraceae bacterium]|jgi:uncharacterized protein YbaP (TraB family)|nr:TraB/GumN family protein [Dissulfurispiraceae bacterium]